jgi:hypothetical protein
LHLIPLCYGTCPSIHSQHLHQPGYKTLRIFDTQSPSNKGSDLVCD